MKQTYFVTELLSELDEMEVDTPLQKFAVSLQGIIKDSVKFRLPKNGRVFPEATFSDGENLCHAYKKYADGQRLPFKNMSIEWEMEPEDIFDKQVAIIFQADKDDTIHGFIFGHLSEPKPRWLMLPARFQDNYVQGLLGHSAVAPDLNDVVRDAPVEFLSPVRYTRSVVVELLCFLACSNAEISTEPNNREKLNAKRLKKGKPPFYSYKVLTIAQNDGSSSRGITGNGRSPRVHLRRGHIRRLADRTVWVNSAVVGDKSKGLVNKDYAVSEMACPVEVALWP
jgi:hypothetical protein